MTAGLQGAVGSVAASEEPPFPKPEPDLEMGSEVKGDALSVGSRKNPPVPF